jgi:formiminoglutamase
MQQASHLNILTTSAIRALTIERDGETKLGQALSALEPPKADSSLASLQGVLKERSLQGVRYAIIGVPEDIGPRANLGRGGAHEAWSAFLGTFLNIQANEFLAPERICVVGEVDVADLLKRASTLDGSNQGDLKALRELCGEIDTRVAAIIEQIVQAGLEPIVVGGGHNNTYPIQKGLSTARGARGEQVGVCCVNCDPHADFRALEGRHSGNGFTYSQSEGLLKAYYVLGLHESYNSQAVLDNMRKADFGFCTYEDVKIRGKQSWEDCVGKAIEYVKASPKLPVGIELDLDSIAFLPVSAETPSGLTIEEAAHYVYRVASECSSVAYFHVPEGAPMHHANTHTGARYVGRAIVNAVLAYIKGREVSRARLT